MILKKRETHIKAIASAPYSKEFKGHEFSYGGEQFIWSNPKDNFVEFTHKPTGKGFDGIKSTKKSDVEDSFLAAIERFGGWDKVKGLLSDCNDIDTHVNKSYMRMALFKEFFELTGKKLPECRFQKFHLGREYAIDFEKIWSWYEHEESSIAECIERDFGTRAREIFEELMKP